MFNHKNSYLLLNILLISRTSAGRYVPYRRKAKCVRPQQNFDEFVYKLLLLILLKPSQDARYFGNKIAWFVRNTVRCSRYAHHGGFHTF